MTPPIVSHVHASRWLVVAFSITGCLFDPSGSPSDTDTDTTTTGGSTTITTSTTDTTALTDPLGSTTGPSSTSTSLPESTTTTDDPSTATTSTDTGTPPSEPFCGDGVVDPDIGESCDDGDMHNDNACTNFCAPQACGDGFIDLAGGEECDHGGFVEAGGCSDTCACELDACGDGKVDPGEECDDRNGDDSDGCSACCQRLTYNVFVTSTSVVAGELGGFAAADERCSDLAQQAGLPGTYLAWLAPDRGVPSAAQIDFKQPYALVGTGEIVAHSLKELRSGQLAAPIHVDETGADIGPVPPDPCSRADLRVWTGTDAHAHGVPGETCLVWSETEGVARFGAAGPADGTWTDCQLTAPCDTMARLYCFEVQS